MRRHSPQERGLTLIELVVAMAIFALIAVMGLQALTGAMRMRDRLAGIDRETAELGLALGLLRADLGAVTPLLFHPPEGPPLSALRLDPAGRVLGLSLAGQPSLPARPGPGLQRAEWRFDAGEGTLSRRVWPVLNPSEATRAAPEVVLMTGLRGWSLRTYWDRVGWVSGSTGGASATAPEVGSEIGPEIGRGGDDATGDRQPESYSSILPEAVELTLQTADLGRIVLVESLK